MKVKGAALISTLEYMNNNASTAQREEIISELKESDLAVIQNKIFPSGWYPFETLINLTRSIDFVLGSGDLRLARHIGKFSAEHDLKTIYKIFYKIGSPQFVVSRGAQVFATYYNVGNLETLESKKGYMLLELTDFPEITEIFLQRVAGWMEKTLELSGGRGPRVTTSFKSDEQGNKIVQFKGEWG